MFSCSSATLKIRNNSSEKYVLYVGKREAIPVQVYYRPTGFQEVEAARFLHSRHMKVGRLSDLPTGHIFFPGNIPATHFSLGLSRLQGYSAAERNMSMKNSNDTIGDGLVAQCLSQLRHRVPLGTTDSSKKSANTRLHGVISQQIAIFICMPKGFSYLHQSPDLRRLPLTRNTL